MEHVDHPFPSEQSITLIVRDEPGTLFLVASVFSNRGISMRSIRLHEERVSRNNLDCSQLTICFLGEDSRKKIICRLLSRLDCVLESG